MPNPKTAPSGIPYPEPENGWVHKCDVDNHLDRHLPIPTQVVSNEEYFPMPQTRKQAAVEHRMLAMADANAKKLGQKRRDFLRTSCGMATAFAAMNSVFGPYFRVDAAEMLEQSAAADTKDDYFVFDVQTHHVAAGLRIPALLGYRRAGAAWNPDLRNRRPQMDDLYIENYIKEVFLDSQTDMVVISGFPSPTDETNILPPDKMVKTRSWINELTSSRRVISHGLMAPDLGTQNLEKMQVQAEKLKIEAWKGYPGQPLGPRHNGWWLDDEKEAYPVFEYSRKIGIKNLCFHKGLPLAGFNIEHCNPKDVIKASQDFPDMNFLIYHSGFKGPQEALPVVEGNFEKTTYVPWVSDLCEARKKNPKMTNVYMELGSTFGLMVISQPKLCCHVLGMILDAYGPDRVLWGTDSIWWGSPQWQIEAMKRITMPQELIDRFGYKPLTREVKAKILGLNGAKVYNVDPSAKRNPIPTDYIDRLRKMYQAVGPKPSNTQYGWVPAGTGLA
jgi:uncharacterized protein